MTSLDVLFWLLIALLAGVAWAIEAGLAMRHNRVLLSTTLSAFGSILFIMFWIPDESALELGQRSGPIKRPAGAAEERGGFQYEDVAKKDDQANSKDEAKKDPDGPPEYSKEPFRDCKLCPELVIVTPRDGVGDLANAYAVGRLELLRKEYAQFVKETSYVASESCDIQSTRKGKFGWRNPGFEQDGQHPVVCVNTPDAEAYLAWLATKAGRPYRLLSQAQWENMASAGTGTPYWQGEMILPFQANFGRSRDGTIPGGSLPANTFGLSDVNGNVWELLATCKVEKTGERAVAARGEECSERLIKGGGWSSPAEQLRIEVTRSIPVMQSTNFVGFRIARDVDEQDAGRILTKAKKAALAADDKAAAEIDAKERASAEKAELDRLEGEAKAREDEAKAKVAEAKAREAEAREAAKAAAQSK